MRRLRVLVRIVAALVVPAAIVSCALDSTAPNTALMKEPFFISGAITEIGRPWGYRVKGEPGSSYRVTDAFFTIDSNTEIRRADGGAATAADLVVGRQIRLWITGAIAESLPPQVGARLIVLE